MNELKVGLLALLAIGSMFVVTFTIVADKSGLGEYIEYRTIINDASGIHKNSTIKVAGIVAGRITSIELSGSQAMIIFNITKKIKVTRYSILKIKSVGFLGDKYVDIYLGNPDAPRLAEGSMIIAQGGAGIEELAKDAGDVLLEIKEVTMALKDSIYDDEQKNMIRQIIMNTNKAMSNAKDITKQFKDLVAKNEVRIDGIVKRVEQIADQVAFETNRNAKDSFMYDLKTVKPILANLDASMKDVRQMIADVKAGKGTVGKLLRDEKIVDQVNETLAGVQKIVGKVNRYETDISLFTGVNSLNSDSKTEFNLDIAPSPERFYSAGIVMSDFGPEISQSTTTTTEINGGAPSVTEEREVNDSAYKFNLQIGRRINNFQMRAGLIESTGGIGFDYLIPSYGFKTSLDVYDYQEEAGPNVRLSSQIKLWNVFYTQVALEDLMSKTDDQSYTISAGLRFNDEDLSSLIGILAK